MVGNFYSTINEHHHHNTTKAARTQAMPLRMVFATSVACPLGGLGPATVEPLPLSVAGSLTGGRGGSITPSSVRIGFGASAGGKLCSDIIEIRPPGGTEDMYIGTVLYTKHRFPVYANIEFEY